MKRSAALVIACVLLLTGCGSTTPIAADIGPAQIKLPIVHSGEVATAKRIVALANGSAEIVASLGYLDNLVGRDIASTMPELSQIPIDTDAHQVSVEKVLSQKPDLILIDNTTSPASALDTLKKSGIRIVTVPSPFTLLGVLEKERAVANALGTPKAAALLAKDITDQSFPKSATKVAFLYLRGTASIYLIGGKGSGADSLLAAIGMRDVGAENLQTPYTALTAESLIQLKPDVILLMTKGLASVGGIDGLVALPGIAQTPAGQNKRVVTVDDSLLLSFGPRTGPTLPLLRTAIDKVMK
jgi:iron complex transport system substrate-binding protein